MPIDRLEKPRKTDVDPSSVKVDLYGKRMLCCHNCGETTFTLRRIRDAEGNKIKPPKFICVECYKR